MVKTKKTKFKFHITDLRAHNYVKCTVSNDAGIYQIIGIDGMHYKVMLNGARKGTWYDLDKIKPIKLTKELLIDIGFEEHKQVEGSFSFGTDGINLSYGLLIGRLSIKTERTTDKWIHIDGVEYIHQIQNFCSVLKIESEMLYTK